MGAGASLTIWAGDCPPEADEPPVIFAKLGAIFYADLHQIESQTADLKRYERPTQPQTLKRYDPQLKPQI